MSDEDHLSSYLDFINNKLDISALPDAEIGEALPAPVRREDGIQAASADIETQLRARVDVFLDQIFAHPGSALHDRLTPHHLLILDQILKRVGRETLWMPRTQAGVSLALIEMAWVVLGQLVKDGDIDDDTDTDH